MKTISKFLIISIVLLLVSLGTISAAEMATNSSQVSDNVVEKTVTNDNVIKDTGTENVVQDNQYKTIEKKSKVETKDTVKESSASITVTSSNYNQFFTNTSGKIASTDLIQAGDTINLQGTFNNVNFAVDKSITLTSLNKNALLYNCTVYVNGSKSSGARISNLTITNSKEQTTGIVVKDTSNLLITDNTIKVNGKSSFAFLADRMGYSTIKFNHFQATCPEDQGYAHTTFAFGDCNYNNVANNTIRCDANGIYLSWYGNFNVNFDGGISNYNNITGNRIIGNNSGWCYTIQVMGNNNRITYNTVSGGYRGISTQDYVNNIISNNDVHALSTGIYAAEQSTVTNNYVHVSSIANGITVGGDKVKVSGNTITAEDGSGIEICANHVTISDNDITSNTYGIHSKGQYSDIVIENNKIASKKEGILFEKQSSSKKINHVCVSGNNIKSESDYAINFYDAGARSTSEINITVTSSNVLTSKKGNGLDVAYLKPANVNENSGTDTNQVITVTAGNYDEWFDEGVANIKVKQNATVYLVGTFNNCDFTFNKKVHIIGTNCNINRGTITLTGDAHLSTVTGITFTNYAATETRHSIEVIDVNNCNLSNLVIKNNGSYESLGIFLCGSGGNTISGCTLYNYGDYINNGILLYSSDSNTIVNNKIMLQQSNKNQPYDESIMFNERIGIIKEVLHNHGIILLYSSDNVLNKNTVTITSQFTSYTVPSSDCKNSVVGIDIYFNSHNNKVTSNTVSIKSKSPYVYGMGVLGGYWGSSSTSMNAKNNVFKSNTVSITAGYFGTGFIAGRNSMATTVESNKFVVYTYKTSTLYGDYANGITLENSTTSTISKNSINMRGQAIYSIELFDSSNNVINGNTIVSRGTYPYGIAATGSSNNKITANTLTLRKESRGYPTAAMHSDVIPYGDQGIMFMQTSLKNNITENTINTNAARSIKFTSTTKNNRVFNNSLKSKTLYGDASVTNEHSSNKVTNNYLYPLKMTVNAVTGSIGKNVTFKAKVTSTTTALGNVKVTFKLGSNVIGTKKVVNGTATLTYKLTTAWQATTYPLIVTAQATKFQNASVQTKATFKKDPVKTVVKVAKVYQKVGSKVVLKANITTATGGKIGSGKAEIYIDNVKVATKNVKLGAVSYTYAIKPNAKNVLHKIKVVYLGNKDYAKSTGSNYLGVQSISTMTVKNCIGTIGSNVKIQATIKSGRKAIKTGKVQIYINNKLVATKWASKGVLNYAYKIPTSMNKGKYNLKIVYLGNATAASVTKTAKITVNAMKPVFYYSKTTAYAGKKVSLVLYINNGAKGKNKYNANGGRVHVKLNGKKLTYANGTVISGNIVNGKITFKFTASKALKGYQNLTFVYAGNTKFQSGTKAYTKGLYIK